VDERDAAPSFEAQRALNFCLATGESVVPTVASGDFRILKFKLLQWRAKNEVPRNVAPRRASRRFEQRRE
jgi:hypothetical protein